jgi:hypothetical protein
MGNGPFPLSFRCLRRNKLKYTEVLVFLFSCSVASLYKTNSCMDVEMETKKKKERGEGKRWMGNWIHGYFNNAVSTPKSVKT